MPHRDKYRTRNPMWWWYWYNTLRKNCVLYLPMIYHGSAHTEAKDWSGKGNHGTIHGATKITAPWNQALSFDGENDYVDCGNDASLDITDAITISAWVYPREKSGSYRAVISKGSNEVTPFDIRMDRTSSGNHIFGKLQTSAGSVNVPNTAINNNQWYHAVLLYDGIKVELFLNGQSKCSNPQTGTINTNAVNLMIGGNTKSEFWNGSIDEVRIYNKALTAAQIFKIYNWTKSAFGHSL